MKSFRLTVVLVLTVLFLTACPIKNSKPEWGVIALTVDLRRRPGQFLPSLASTDAPQCIASRHDLCRHCVQCSIRASLLNGVVIRPPMFITKSKALTAGTKNYLLAKKAGLTECGKWSHERLYLSRYTVKRLPFLSNKGLLG